MIKDAVVEAETDGPCTTLLIIDIVNNHMMIARNDEA